MAYPEDNAILESSTGRARGTSQRRRGGVINEVQFCGFIADPPRYDYEEPDIQGFMTQPDKDLDRVSMYQGDFDTKTQSQVQSLLRERRFLGWMRSKYPDLILILADLPSSGLERVAVVSVLCATLTTSLISLNREDCVLHFFCGLHLDSHDTSPGPRGLVRSLIMQVFTHLQHGGLVSLDFIDNRDYVEAIENQDLYALCDTLHALLSQCEPGTSVHCILDSITLFERGVWFRDLKIVLSCLKEIVEDGRMPAIFKVMLTSSASCTPELRSLLSTGSRHDDTVLYLPEETFFVDGDLSQHATEREIRRPGRRFGSDRS